MSLKKKQDEHLIPVEVWRIYPYSESSPPQTFLVVLKGEEDRFVPISIGAPEGQYLVMAMQQVSFPRPLTHNLFQDLLEKVKGEVRRLVIHTLKEDIFHAYLLIQTEEDVFYLDCRPSDGMILATLMAIPIFMSPEVMEEAGKELGAMLNIADLGEDVSGAGNGEDVDPSLVEVEVREETGVEKEAEGAVEEKEMSELELLKAQLDRLVAEEAYEEAARLRDKISRMENGGSDSS